MSKITNPNLKDLISGIASRATVGRINDLSWGMLAEAKKTKKVMLKKESLIANPEDDTIDTGEAAAAPEVAPTPEKVEDAQADATAAKAELEKANVEKDQAEKEIDQNTHIKLNSGSGLQFLLGKLLDAAFKTNTIDSLAGDMVDKLKINTPEAIAEFTAEVAPYKVLPGMAELLASMGTMASKTPVADDSAA